MAATSTPHPPTAGQGPAKGGSPTTASPPAPETEPPPHGGGGGGGGTGGQPAGSPSKGGGWGGKGDPSQPLAKRRPTAAGKRPVQAGSPGLSTPSKPKRGHGVAGANTASRAPAQGRHRPTAARGLFALGFARAATMMSPRDEGQGTALAPPEGLETRGKGHGRAHSEDTLALGAGPSFAPCTLRVRLWGAARWLCHVVLLR